MKESIEFQLKGQDLTLSRHRAIYWKNQSCLIVADLHLGKAGHFRKAGIPVSSQVHVHDLERLDLLIDLYQPSELILLGDLFHSEKNREWNDLISWRSKHMSLKTTLTLGNHDIVAHAQFEPLNIHLVEELSVGPFVFTHHPRHDFFSYNLAGHIHPGIRLSGRSRQGVSVPCFYFGERGGLLPAFGNFTGFVPIDSSAGDKVFGVTPTAILPIL